MKRHRQKKELVVKANIAAANFGDVVRRQTDCLMAAVSGAQLTVSSNTKMQACHLTCSNDKLNHNKNTREKKRKRKKTLLFKEKTKQEMHLKSRGKLKGKKQNRQNTGQFHFSFRRESVKSHSIDMPCHSFPRIKYQLRE